MVFANKIHQLLSPAEKKMPLPLYFSKHKERDRTFVNYYVNGAKFNFHYIMAKITAGNLCL